MAQRIIPLHSTTLIFEIKVFLFRIAIALGMLYNKNVKRKTSELKNSEVYFFARLLVYLPSFFLNASVSAGTIWNRSPTTP